MRAKKQFLLPFLIFMMACAVNIAFAQYSSAEEAKEYINDRLSHSIVQKLEPDGTVTMSSPGQKFKFNLAEVSFNYNGGNNDDRVRVFCDACIGNYKQNKLTEKTSRQSFLCESEKEANEVIAAFRFLKRLYAPASAAASVNAKPLKVTDSTLNTKSVGEAIDFINENLSYSMISGVDDNGMLTINAPDEIYIVDLKKAEFGYNDASDGSKVRIYGDFCIAQKDSDGDQDWLSRKSFQTSGRVKAYKVITVLYYLKGTFAETDPRRIEWLTDPGPARPGSYNSIPEAIRFINSRLTYSIVLDVDEKGLVTLNAPDDVYRFNLNDVKINNAVNQSGRTEWFPFVVERGMAYGVFVSCEDCIKKYSRPRSFDTVDEQVFQCGSSTEAKDIVKAFGFIKGKLVR